MSLPGGIDNPVSKNAMATGKSVAINDVNLGGFDKWTNCGKCVQVTAKLASQPFHTFSKQQVPRMR